MKTEKVNKTVKPQQYIARHGQDMPEIRNWKWMAPISNNMERTEP